MKNLLILLAIIALSHSSIAQRDGYAFDVLDTLCSTEMYGRGYVKDGQQKAAVFIQNEFKRMGLQPVDGDYLQPFTLDINTFPMQPSVMLDGQSLKLGVDYILKAPSGSGSGRARLLSLEKFRKKGRPSGFGVVVSAEEFREAMRSPAGVQELEQAAVVVVLNDTKLTASLSQSAWTVPVIEVLNAEEKPPKKIVYNISTKLKEDYTAHNVMAKVEGTGQPDSVIIFCAHYDHLGGMGNVYFPGANDNAAGVAMILSLAQYYVEHPHKYTTMFVGFGGEEAGLVGSEYFVRKKTTELEKIIFVMNMDLVGTGQKGITVVNGSVFPDAFDQLVAVNEEGNYVEEIKRRGKAANSDHYHFSEKGVPAFFIYARGTPEHYHDINDNGSDLELPEFDDIQKLLIDFFK